MGDSSCRLAAVELCNRCSFACRCFSCTDGDRCSCSCRHLLAAQLILVLLSILIGVVAFRESRRFLAVWGSIFAFESVCMVIVTFMRGPDPNDLGFSCSGPFLIWATLMFITSLTFYTSEFILASDASNKESFVFDPSKRRWIPRIKSLQMFAMRRSESDVRLEMDE